MTKSLRERVLEHFATLRIPLTAEQLDRVLTAAEQEALSALEVLDRLVGEQAARRRERSIERRIVAARFAERKTLDTFDWNFNKTIQRVQYEQLATAEFVRRTYQRHSRRPVRCRQKPSHAGRRTQRMFARIPRLLYNLRSDDCQTHRCHG